MSRGGKVKLEYFPFHARAIMIRMALHYCNVDYEDMHVSMEAMQAKKAAG